MKNSADLDNTLRDLQNSSYPTKVEFNNKFKNKLTHANLGRCKFISIMHLYREVQEIKVCSGLQIHSKQQVSFVFMLFLSCVQTYFAAKRVKCSADCSAIHFVFTTKTTEPRPQVSSVNGLITCNQTALLTSFCRHRFNMTKFLPNLVNIWPLQ